MRKRKNEGKVKTNWRKKWYPVALVLGVIMGVLYIDKPESEEHSMNLVNYPSLVMYDTVLIHDTLYRDRIVVKWKYKGCCCCCKRKYVGCERLNNDTVKSQLYEKTYY